MGSKKVVDESADLIEVELGSGVRIQHGCMMNKTGIALEDRFNCQGLHVDVGLHESCELDGMRPTRTG